MAGTVRSVVGDVDLEVGVIVLVVVPKSRKSRKSRGSWIWVNNSEVVVLSLALYSMSIRYCRGDTLCYAMLCIVRQSASAV